MELLQGNCNSSPMIEDSHSLLWKRSKIIEFLIPGSYFTDLTIKFGCKLLTAEIFHQCSLTDYSLGQELLHLMNLLRRHYPKPGFRKQLRPIVLCNLQKHLK